MGSFFYTSSAGFVFVFMWEFLLHIPCWFLFLFIWGNFSYTSRAVFIFIWAVSPTHPMLALFLSGEFFLPILCWLKFDQRTFFHITDADFIFIEGVTHPVLASFLSGQFLLHISCWLHSYTGSFPYTSHADCDFMWGVSLTHPMLTVILCGEFLLHIPC